MCKMLFLKSGCDYLSTVCFQKSISLPKRTGKQGRRAGACQKCLCCCPPVPSRLSVLLHSQAQCASAQSPPVAGCWASGPWCSSGSGTGWSRRWQTWGVRTPAPRTWTASSADSTQKLSKTTHFCIPVLLKGRLERKRKLTGEESGREGTFLMERNFFTFFSDTCITHHLNYSIYQFILFTWKIT